VGAPVSGPPRGRRYTGGATQAPATQSLTESQKRRLIVRSPGAALAYANHVTGISAASPTWVLVIDEGVWEEKDSGTT